MAINLHVQLALQSQSHDSGPKPLAVLYSNRSAAFASLQNWDEAADDAEQCTILMPDWSKVRHVALSCIQSNVTLHDITSWTVTRWYKAIVLAEYHQPVCNMHLLPVIYQGSL